MVLLKTEKTNFTPEEIIDEIMKHERENGVFDDYMAYYSGENVKISRRPKPDENNPDNRIAVSYARKIVKTFVGYGYRPKYITIKPKPDTEQMQKDMMEDEIKKQEFKKAKFKAMQNGQILEEPIEEPKKPTESELYFKKIQEIYDKEKESIKTYRAARNVCIFGLSYEIVYVDKELTEETARVEAVPKFATVDPRNMILFYNYDIEPKEVLAIYYTTIDQDTKFVTVYYPDHNESYIMKRLKDTVTTTNPDGSINTRSWELTGKKTWSNFFKAIPVVPYYFDDEIIPIFKCVLMLIDANDELYSDSMNELDRFAFAYLIMKRFGLTDVIKKKDPNIVDQALKLLKRRRIFEYLPGDADIKFLTKDIPTDFIKYMSQALREQIHVQSHVPDFNSETMRAVSGEALKRLLFDFENLVSTSEAEFDVGLYKRIDLITKILKLRNLVPQSSDPNTMIEINHKRNMPLNTKEFADTAKVMKDTGFSMRTICENMPDDMIPDVDEELRRQKEEMEQMIPDYFGAEEDGLDDEEGVEVEDDDEGEPIDE